ncbi:polysaccharide biosynthesis tyrosine autokinase [Leucobacter komagatae]|uniref:polysaccharide biosynthesis tyrosine autokinase n=1 Tax=Leucobacter komagatae TaxID=55969 RepID=UPI001FE6BFE2|nr:polysaccharide biosynthesis tyrosine autokinase [Leucobacter komagatae]
MLILTLALVGAVVAQGATFLTKPRYAATAQLFVATQGNDSVGDLNQGNAFAQGRVASYVTLATSDRILAEVGDEFGLSVEEMRGKISAVNPPNTVLIDVRVESGNAVQAAKIANGVAERLVELVASVENVDAIGGQSAPVALTQVQEAAPPIVPFAPSMVRNLALGGLLGLLTGISAALLIGRFDTRLRTREDISALSETSVLGEFSAEHSAAGTLVINDLETYSIRTERYRQLRTHLQFMNVDGGMRSMLVTSSIPGEGKSTTVANLAIVLAESGVRTLLIDADLRRPRLANILGLEGSVGLTTVLSGRVDLHDVVQTVPVGAGLDVLTSGMIPPNPSEMLGSEKMERLLAAASGEYEVVLLDSPPLVSVSDPAGLATLVSGVLLVASGDGRLHKDQFKRSLEQLRLVRAKLFGLVLNNLDLGREEARYTYETSYQSPDPDAPTRSAERRKKRRAVAQAGGASV